MSKITVHTGTVLPLDQANIDTDQIIPKQFLTAVSRSGYGKHLFHDWRYLDLEEKEPNPEFVLNKPQYAQATIMLTRENFGCGSSREHAPWAITDYGFQVIIAPSFADIFYGNCMNNQLLPVRLLPEQVDELFELTSGEEAVELTVDLVNQRVSCSQHNFDFDVDPVHKNSLINGLDEIGQTLQYEQDIIAFEQSIPAWKQ